jgi:hypothetical protein
MAYRPQNNGITFGQGPSMGGGYAQGGYGSRGYGRSNVPSMPTAGQQTWGSPYYGSNAATGLNDWFKYNQANIESENQREATFNQQINERNMALQHKYGMESQQAEMQMRMAMAGMSMPTNAQIDQARGRFGQSATDYRNMADNGMYSDEDEADLMLDAYNQSGDVTKNMQRGYTDLAKSQGMGVNPNAIYYMGNAGQYQQAAARHSAKAGLMREEAGARERGYAGYRGVQGDLAGLDITPTKENAYIGVYGPEGMIGQGGGRGGRGGQGPYPGIPYGGDARKPKRGRFY